MKATRAVYRAAEMSIGIVGYGGFGRLHCQTVAQLEGVRVAAVIDPRKEAIAAAATAHPHARCFTDVSAALAEHCCDAFIVTSSSDTHVFLASEILQYGASVMIEKPLSPTFQGALELEKVVEAADERGAVTMLGHVMLFNSEVRRLLKEVADRGAPVYIASERHRPAWFSDPNISPYANESPWDLSMSHDVYIALALNGGTPSEVSGRSFAAPHLHGGPHLATADLTWGKDCTARLTCSFLCPDGMPADGVDRIDVFGAGWAAQAHPNPRPLTVWDNTRAHHPLSHEVFDTGDGMLSEQLKSFVQAVRGESPVPRGATFEDGLLVTSILDKLKLSSASHGRPISVSSQDSPISIQPPTHTPSPVTLVDAHIHLFQDGYQAGDIILDDDIASFETISKRLGVEAALVVGFEGLSEVHGWAAGNNAFIVNAAKQHSWIVPLAFVHPDKLQSERDVRSFANDGFVGLSMYIFSEEDAAAVASVPPTVWDFLEEYNLLVSVNSKGEHWRCWDRVVSQHPNLRLLVSHMGLPDACTADQSMAHTACERLEHILPFSQFSNVYVKLSGFYAFDTAGHEYPHYSSHSLVETAHQSFGSDRLLWGSDYPPVLDFGPVVQTVSMFDYMPWLTDDDRRKLLGNTLRDLISDAKAGLGRIGSLDPSK